jgi:hypothetical protein
LPEGQTQTPAAATDSNKGRTYLVWREITVAEVLQAAEDNKMAPTDVVLISVAPADANEPDDAIKAVAKRDGPTLPEGRFHFHHAVPERNHRRRRPKARVETHLGFED